MSTAACGRTQRWAEQCSDECSDNCAVPRHEARATASASVASAVQTPPNRRQGMRRSGGLSRLFVCLRKSQRKRRCRHLLRAQMVRMCTCTSCLYARVRVGTALHRTLRRQWQTLSASSRRVSTRAAQQRCRGCTAVCSVRAVTARLSAIGQRTALGVLQRRMQGPWRCTSHGCIV